MNDQQPDPIEATKLLTELWHDVLNEPEYQTDPDIDELIDCGFVSIRFCLPTQLLGKLACHACDALCLQKGDGSDGKWDPRSFCQKTIVPWNKENEHVLGDSSDPYVSKPLRRERLEADPKNVKGRKYWESLYDLLADVQESDDPALTKEIFLKTLRSIRKKLEAQTFEYPVPPRISAGQTIDLVQSFLSEASGGDRALSVVAALLQATSAKLDLCEEVRREAINAADNATGMAGDIECISKDGQIRFAIEVKDKHLTLLEVKSSINKARKAGLRELIFSSKGINPAEKEEIAQLLDKSWASGTNVYALDTLDMIKTVLPFLGEDGIRLFVELVGRQLDEFNTQPNNRIRWKELLESL